MYKMLLLSGALPKESGYDKASAFKQGYAEISEVKDMMFCLM